jgi:hypothetical protein
VIAGQRARLVGRLGELLLIPAAALIASFARFFHGTSCGHDFEFHLISWLETQRDWSQGVLYPHWAQSPDWGAGEPRFLFYPPLTWLLGALLGYVVAWNWVPEAMTFLFLIGAGFATRALAKELIADSSKRYTATLAGVLATATPYGLFTAYERTAFSELAAAAWIPLLLLYAWRRPLASPNRVWASALDGSAAMLAIVLALTWLTNAPAGVMASYLLAFAALSAAIVLRAWWPVVRACVGAAIGIALAAFYLVPAAWEQRWIAIQQAVDVGMRVTDSWLFAKHASADLALHDEVLRSASVLVVVTTVAAAVGFGICLWRKKLDGAKKHLWLPLALLIPGIFLLQLPVSAPLWAMLPKLGFLQFPWRWLTVLAVPYSVFLAMATPLRTPRMRMISAIGWTVILIGLAGAASHWYWQFCDEEDDVQNQLTVFKSGLGVDGTDEYAPQGADNSLVASGLPDACLVSDATTQLGEGDENATPVWFAEQGSCDDTYTAQLWQDEHKRLEFDSDHDGFVVLRLRRYPAWQITVNGQAETAALPVRDDGLMVLPVHGGATTIDVRWATTPDVWRGRWISLGALLALGVLWLVERRTRALHLSLG